MNEDKRRLWRKRIWQKEDDLIQGRFFPSVYLTKFLCFSFCSLNVHSTWDFVFFTFHGHRFSFLFFFFMPHFLLFSGFFVFFSLSSSCSCFIHSHVSLPFFFCLHLFFSSYFVSFFFFHANAFILIFYFFHHHNSLFFIYTHIFSSYSFSFSSLCFVFSFFFCHLHVFAVLPRISIIFFLHGCFSAYYFFFFSLTASSHFFVVFLSFFVISASFSFVFCHLFLSSWCLCDCFSSNFFSFIVKNLLRYFYATFLFQTSFSFPFFLFFLISSTCLFLFHFLQLYSSFFSFSAIPMLVCL